MKGWLQTLCLTAALAGRVLANEVELVRIKLMDLPANN
jgi:hypothetical protein